MAISKALFVVSISLFLSACQLSLSSRFGPGSLALSDKPRIHILEEITVPAGRTRVFMQSGKIVSSFNSYHPSCNIEVRQLNYDNSQRISPGNYEITGKTEFHEWVVKKQFKEALTVASATNQLAFLFDSRADIYPSVHFYLSGQDANVMRLTCRGVFAPPLEAKMPTKAEIDESLGKIIRVDF